MRVEGNRATIGITDYAQHELGDVVYLDLPEVGRRVQADDLFGTVESVKAVSDLIAPLSGEVLEVNAKVSDAPETVNDDPYGEGWLVRIRLSNPSEAGSLLDAAAYRAQLENA